APTLQVRVFAVVWVVDACLAPIGVLAATVAQTDDVAVLMVLPLAGLLGLLARDRRDRIAQAQHRLEVAVRERSRLQSAVRRMGDALAAKLDLDALVDIALRGSIEALDADVDLLRLTGHGDRRLPDAGSADLMAALRAAGEAATGGSGPVQLESASLWGVALPFDVTADADIDGVICIARRERRFQDDEIALLAELVSKAQAAAADILSHQALREQAMRDP